MNIKNPSLFFNIFFSKRQLSYIIDSEANYINYVNMNFHLL